MSNFTRDDMAKAWTYGLSIGIGYKTAMDILGDQAPEPLNPWADPDGAVSECEFERTTDDGALWFCRLPDGHTGDHACTNACDYPETHPYGDIDATSKETK